jgi:hypothetical protein
VARERVEKYGEDEGQQASAVQPISKHCIAIMQIFLIKQAHLFSKEKNHPSQNSTNEGAASRCTVQQLTRHV